jgi:predicted DNA-binding transcriptional regulator YafY
MMKRIPTEPIGISAKILHNYLNDKGYVVSKRTVERDLNTIEILVGLTCRNSPEGHQWSYQKNTSFAFLPYLSAEEAVSIKLLEKHLRLNLPPHLFSTLTSLFNASEETLKTKKSYSAWLDKVALIPPGITIRPHKIPDNITETLYRGLLENKKVKIRYKQSQRVSVVKLLGLVVRDNKLVFACQYAGYTDTRMILAHRVTEAELLLDESYIPNFDLQQYIASGEIASALSPGNIKLELEVKGYVLKLLQESVIGQNQRITEIDQQWSKAIVELPHSKELEHWLQAHIQDIKIIQPEAVKTRVYKALRDGLALIDP